MNKDRFVVPVVVLAWTVALVLTTSWWLERNDLPNGFQNEADHLYTLTEVFFRFRDNSYADAHQAIWGEYYPPLPHAVASLGLSAFGRSRAVATLSLSAFLLILLAATGWLGGRIRDGPTGALAVTLLALYPSIFGNMRRYEPNLAVSALVALALALIVVRGGMRGRGTAVLLGVVCGFGMLADRVVFAVYLLLPLLIDLLRGRNEGRAAFAARLRDWAIAGGVATLLCGYYYSNFFRIGSGHLHEVLSQVGGEIDATGNETSVVPTWGLRGLLYYPLAWLDCQMGLALGGLTLLGIGGYLVRGRKSIAADSRSLLEAWLFGGLLLFTLLGKKQPFYSIPLLAPAALCAACGLRALPRPGLRMAVGALVLVLGVHQLAFLTTHRGLVPSPGRWAWMAGASPFPDRWLGYEYTQAAAPFPQRLRLDHAAQLCSDERARTGKPYIYLFSEGGGAEEGQVMPTLRLYLDSRKVEGFRKSPPEALVENAPVAGCFVYIGTEGRSWPTGASLAATMRRFSAGEPQPAVIDLLSSLEARAKVLGSWMGAAGEEVHVYALGEGG
ncbi:MAG TPA: hypothetical protein DIU15_04835 [Deltaproteobacteria bacterium]|nr:hypothetical protein [Deltaproteobacteria bacterium]HCP45341.1 hypothetical protein [Deltaproteobacteria bacterium]